jgi:hypothetical protein
MRLVSEVSIVEKKRKFSAKAGDGSSGHWQMSDGTLVEYTSTIERRFVEICDWANEVQFIKWEPMRFRFYDHIAERFRHYTPDYLVQLQTSRGTVFRYIIEVKPYLHYMKRFREDLRGFPNRAIIAATSYARNQPNCDFAVITDRWVESRGIKNIRMIQHASTFEFVPEIKTLMVSEILTNPGINLDHLLSVGEKNGFAHADIITQVLKLCGCDEVNFDIRHPLTDGSRFYEGARSKVFKI